MPGSVKKPLASERLRPKARKRRSGKSSWTKQHLMIFSVGWDFQKCHKRIIVFFGPNRANFVHRARMKQGKERATVGSHHFNARFEEKIGNKRDGTRKTSFGRWRRSKRATKRAKIKCSRASLQLQHGLLEAFYIFSNCASQEDVHGWGSDQSKLPKSKLGKTPISSFLWQAFLSPAGRFSSKILSKKSWALKELLLGFLSCTSPLLMRPSR